MIIFAREVLDVLFAGVWQDACIAIAVTAALRVFGRRANAATRYIVWHGVLVTIVLTPLATTLPSVMSHATLGGYAGALAAHANDAPAANGPIGVVARRIDVALSDRAVLALAGAWIVGVLAFILRIGLGSLQLRRLVRRSRRLADRADVRVYVSPDIGVPLACGFSRPAILVPVTLAAPTQEAFECVVLHEIAHVRRRDALANAYERALHALLFFNPVVLLVLRSIALEREVACDDFAVAQTRDVESYVRTLASLAIWNAGTSFPSAYSATGFGHATIARIKHLEDARRNGDVTISHYAIGGFTFVLAIIALTLQSFAPAIAFAPQMVAATPVVASTACSKDVRYVGGPPPSLPGDIKLHGSFTTLVRVDVSSSGKVTQTTLAKSSGHPALDRAAVAAAKKGTFSPAMHDCRPISSTYAFIATFQP